MIAFGKLYRVMSDCPRVTAVKDDEPSRLEAAMSKGEGGLEGEATATEDGEEPIELEGRVDSPSEFGAVTEPNDTCDSDAELGLISPVEDDVERRLRFPLVSTY